MQATRRNLVLCLLVPALLALLVAGTGCQGMPGSTVTTTPPPTKTLTVVSVRPTSANVSAGETQQFTATATYSDGSTANVSSNVTWTVGSSAVATINASGLLTAVAGGSTSVTASLSGVRGTASLDVETVTVTKTLQSIAVTPQTASVNIGATQQFIATGTYSDGSTATITPSWSTSSALVSTISSAGLATGVAAGSTTVTASSDGISGTASMTVNPNVVTSISVSPTSANLTEGQQQQFTATATYNIGPPANVTSSATWSSGNTSYVAVNSSGLATAVNAPTTGTTTTSVTASFGGFSGSASVDVAPSTSTAVNIPMFHVDQNRSGANLNETVLTPANVSSSFGKLFSYLVDGYVYGQPLLVSNLTMGDGTTHNVLFTATENDSVYAFDADSNSGANNGLLWKVSLLQSGETPITNGPIQPVEGITSTPAIDTTTNTMYVVSAQTSSAGGTFRLYALDITTGNQKPGSPIQITAQVAGTNGTTLGTDCLQRAALLVLPGSPAAVFIGFGSCASGWLLAYTYDGSTFTQSGVFNSSPNLTGEGAYASAGGIWMGGGGPVSDGNYVYVTTGNGPWDGQTAFSDSVLKFTQGLQLLDYFTPDAYEYMDCNDSDLAAGGLLLIPGSTQLIAGGKIGKIFMINSDDLGHEQANDAGATYFNWFEGDLISPYQGSCTDENGNTWTTNINEYEIFGTSAFYNGSIYLGVTPTSSALPHAPVRQFVFSGTSFSYGSYTEPNILEGSYGTTPFISANNTSHGVLWMIDHGNPLQNTGGVSPTNAILRAYDANNLAAPELYDSSMNSGDTPGYGIKFTAPIVANGKAYISTAHDLTTVQNPQGELDVYGLK